MSSGRYKSLVITEKVSNISPDSATLLWCYHIVVYGKHATTQNSKSKLEIWSALNYQSWLHAGSRSTVQEENTMTRHGNWIQISFRYCNQGWVSLPTMQKSHCFDKVRPNDSHELRNCPHWLCRGCGMLEHHSKICQVEHLLTSGYASQDTVVANKLVEFHS